MKNEVCNGRSPWKCSVKEANATLELKSRGVDIVGLMNPIAVLNQIKQAEWDELMSQPDSDKKDDVQSSV